MKLEVGKSYVNGYGAVFTIKRSPNENCRWFMDDCMNYYHEDGSFVQLGDVAGFNLVREVALSNRWVRS